MAEEEERSDTRHTAPRPLTGRPGLRGTGHRDEKEETADGYSPNPVERSLNCAAAARFPRSASEAGSRQILFHPRR